MIRVMYNEYGPSGRKLAEDTAQAIRKLIPGEPLSIRSLSLASNEDRIWAEVSINFPMTNVDHANSVVDKLKAAGYDARTYHDND